MIAYATFPGLAPGRSERAVVRAGEETEHVDVRLKTGGTLSGRLVDKTGLGVEGVEICVVPSFETNSAVTAAGGAFEFAPLGAGEYAIACLSDGYRLIGNTRFKFPESGDLTAPELRVEKLAEGHIAGQVVDQDGAPVVLAEVTARSKSRKEPERHGRNLTDDRGEFLIQNLGGATEFEVVVFRDGRPEAILCCVPVDTNRLTIELKSCGRVSGTVVGGGVPLQSFELRTVSLYPTEEGERKVEGAWRRVESVDGVWYLDKVAPVRTVIEIREENHISGASEPVDVRPRELVEGVEIRLPRAGVVSGLATHGPTRTPAAGVRVRAFTRDRFFGWLLTSSGEEEDIVDTTGDDGRFKLTRLDPRRSYNVVAWRDGLATRILRGVRVGDSTDIVLADEGRLEVVLRGGGEAGNRLVQIEQQSVPDGELGYSTNRRTDGQNVVEFGGLPEGRYRVVVRGTDSRAIERVGVVDRHVSAGETTGVEIDIEDLRGKHGSIRGLLSNHENVGQVPLRLVSRGDSRELYGNVRTAPDGRFSFTGVSPGEYLILGRWRGSRDERVRQEVTVERGATAEVTVEWRPE